MTTTSIALDLPFQVREITRDQACRMLDDMPLEDAMMCAARLTEEIAAHLGRMPDDRGQFRAVWIEGDIVIKVPVCANGYRALSGAAANAYEVREAEAGGYPHPRTDDRVPISACRIVWHETGMPIVIMERIDTNPDRDMPDWSRRVDKEQVGWNERTQGFEVYDAGCKVGDCGAPWEAIEVERA
jgi:hypothetical protein